MAHFDAELPFVPHNPKNYLFFKHLFRKLGPDFVTADIRKEENEAQERFNESMRRYFEKSILMNAVTECIHLKTENKKSGVHPFYLNAIKLPTKQNKIAKELQLFGINEESISELIESEKNQKDKENLSKLIEDHITEYCQTILTGIGRSDVPVSDINLFEKALKEFVSEARQVAERTKLRPKEADVQNMLLTYYKELTEGLSMLQELVSLRRKMLEFEMSQSQNFSLKCKALYLKIRVFELKVLVATYSKECIQALNIIKSKVDEKEENLLKEKADKKLTLEAYQILGPRYEELVKEYTNLVKEIEKQEWTLETLKETKDA